MIINGLRIPHPATFKPRTRAPSHASVQPMFHVKRTVTIKPQPLRAIHAMPVIAIVGAIGSIVAGVGAVAAATSVVGTVLAGAMIVGGAATLIGAATGNQNLMKYGSILSAVGAVGTAGMSLFGGADTAASAGVGAGAQSANTPGISGADVIAADNAASTAATPLAAPQAITPNVPSGILADGTLTVDGAGVPASGVLASPAPAPAVAQPAAVTPFSTGDIKPFDPNQGGMLNMPGSSTLNSGSPQGFFNSVGQWVSNNKDLAKMGMDAVAGYAKGKAGEPLQQAQINGINANIDATKARTEIEKQAAARAAQKADWGRGISKPISYYTGG